MKLPGVVLTIIASINIWRVLAAPGLSARVEVESPFVFTGIKYWLSVSTAHDRPILLIHMVGGLKFTGSELADKFGEHWRENICTSLYVRMAWFVVKANGYDSDTLEIAHAMGEWQDGPVRRGNCGMVLLVRSRLEHSLG